jgi:hypothetical protein
MSDLEANAVDIACYQGPYELEPRNELKFFFFFFRFRTMGRLYAGASPRPGPLARASPAWHAAPARDAAGPYAWVHAAPTPSDAPAGYVG